MVKKKQSTFFNFTSTLGRIILLGIVILFLVNISRSIYKNHSIKKQIADLKEEINTLENEKLNLQNRILYYETETYKELEAREHLNYKKKGENVIVYLSDENTTNTEQSVKHNISQEEKENQADGTPNWQKWMKYIFG